MKIHFGKRPPTLTPAMLAAQGRGRYRQIEEVDRFVRKKHLPTVIKNFGYIWIEFPAPLYIRCAHGLSDMNRLELQMYQRYFNQVPKPLKANFAQVFNVDGDNGKSVLTMEKVADHTGERSKPLSSFDIIYDRTFWTAIESMIVYFSHLGIGNLGFSAENIVVRASARGQTPVLVDYKYMDNCMFPLQPWNRLPSMGVLKMMRQTDRLKAQFRFQSNLD